MSGKEVVSIKNISINVTAKDKNTNKIFDAQIVYDIKDKKDSIVE